MSMSALHLSDSNSKRLPSITPLKSSTSSRDKNISQIKLRRELAKSGPDTYKISKGGTVERRCPFRLLSGTFDEKKRTISTSKVGNDSDGMFSSKRNRDMIFLVLPSKYGGNCIFKKSKNRKTIAELCREEKPYWLAKRKCEHEEREKLKQEKLEQKRKRLQNMPQITQEELREFEKEMFET